MRPTSGCIGLVCVAALVGIPEWVGAIEAATEAAGTRPAYEIVKRRARAWLDVLEVDPVELMQHGIKGKKKLAEILDVYLALLVHSPDPADAGAIRRRVADLAQHAKRPEYHDMAHVNDVEFTENSMSYLRVAWLLDRFGIETSAYREEIRKIQPRLDDHLRERGPWQQAMFLEYYERFGLTKPLFLSPASMQGGVIARRVAVDAYDASATYDLTHEVFVAYDYGKQRTQTRFSAADLTYTWATVPQLSLRYIAARNPDLAGELLSCMTYLGWHDDPAYRATIDYLLGSQNFNGTWGDYEAYRTRYGKYVDHHVYLHTTMVVLESLVEAYEGGWPRRPAPPAAK